MKVDGNLQKSPRKEVEVVRACDAKRGALGRMEGNGNEIQGRRKIDGWTQ